MVQITILDSYYSACYVNGMVYLSPVYSYLCHNVVNYVVLIEVDKKMW